MVRYETLILAVPEITTEEISKLETQFTKMVKAAKGNIISFEKWGKYSLAYPVRNNEYGVYFLSRFELPVDDRDKLFADLKDLFAIKYHDMIMRFAIDSLPYNKSLEYQKPRSLEEMPKDEGFLGKKSREYGDDSRGSMGMHDDSDMA